MIGGRAPTQAQLAPQVELPNPQLPAAVVALRLSRWASVSSATRPSASGGCPRPPTTTTTATTPTISSTTTATTSTATASPAGPDYLLSLEKLKTYESFQFDEWTEARRKMYRPTRTRSGSSTCRASCSTRDRVHHRAARLLHPLADAHDERRASAHARRARPRRRVADEHGLHARVPRPRAARRPVAARRGLVGRPRRDRLPQRLQHPERADAEGVGRQGPRPRRPSPPASPRARRGPWHRSSDEPSCSSNTPRALFRGYAQVRAQFWRAILRKTRPFRGYAQWLDDDATDRDERDYTALGAGCGVAAAFKSPISATVLIIEEIAARSRGLRFASFFGIGPIRAQFCAQSDAATLRRLRRTPRTSSSPASSRTTWCRCSAPPPARPPPPSSSSPPYAHCTSFLIVEAVFFIFLGCLLGGLGALWNEIVPRPRAATAIRVCQDQPLAVAPRARARVLIYSTLIIVLPDAVGEEAKCVKADASHAPIDQRMLGEGDHLPQLFSSQKVHPRRGVQWPARPRRRPQPGGHAPPRCLELTGSSPCARSPSAQTRSRRTLREHAHCRPPEPPPSSASIRR